jgi:hypothetical protein
MTEGWSQSATACFGLLASNLIGCASDSAATVPLLSRALGSYDTGRTPRQAQIERMAGR